MAIFRTSTRRACPDSFGRSRYPVEPVVRKDMRQLLPGYCWHAIRRRGPWAVELGAGNLRGPWRMGL